MGDYAPAGATGTCLHCPSDKFPRLAHTYCFRFPTGKFSPNAQSGSCQDCAVGTHAGPDAGQADCTACRSGKYQHITGQYYCIGCPEGKYQEFPGRTFCASCPTCEYSGNVATECYSLATACRVSHWSAWGLCDLRPHLRRGARPPHPLRGRQPVVRRRRLRRGARRRQSDFNQVKYQVEPPEIRPNTTTQLCRCSPGP